MSRDVEMLIIVLVFTFVSVLARHAKVERLEVSGVYRKPNCSASVTCYVRTYDEFATVIRWTGSGGPPYFKGDIHAGLPGFVIGTLERMPFGFRQNISIKEWCYNKLELQCKANGSKKSVKLHAGTGITVHISLRTIIGIVFGVLCVAIAVGSFIMIRRRRAAAKARNERNTEVVTLNPPTDSYPSQTTTVYPQGPGYAYPQQNVSTYPPPPGAGYPAPPGAVYPPPPGAAYPPPLGAAYPAPPGAAYPSVPASDYPQYSTTMHAQATPYPQNPAHMQQPLSQDPPPYSSLQQPPLAGFKSIN